MGIVKILTVLPHFTDTTYRSSTLLVLVRVRTPTVKGPIVIQGIFFFLHNELPFGGFNILEISRNLVDLSVMVKFMYFIGFANWWGNLAG